MLEEMLQVFERRRRSEHIVKVLVFLGVSKQRLAAKSQTATVKYFQVVEDGVKYHIWKLQQLRCV